MKDQLALRCPDSSSLQFMRLFPSEGKSVLKVVYIWKSIKPNKICQETANGAVYGGLIWCGQNKKQFRTNTLQ